MKVTVCEMSDDAAAFEIEWTALVDHVRTSGSEIVLLPEMPFSPWFGLVKSFDERSWREAVELHDSWLSRLTELVPATVLSTRPVEHDGRRLNEGFAWDAESGYRPTHHKYYLPDEPGFFEASWYERGDGKFEPTACGTAQVGFEICSELWAFEQARLYGKKGVHIIATPRATEKSSIERWLVAGRATAITSGAYSLSSNRSGLSKDGSVEFGGHGWIIGPDGAVLGSTSSEQPFVTIDINLEVAEKAKTTYPRYAV